jgi:hypothetical protein
MLCLDANPACHGGKPATNRLSYGTAQPCGLPVEANPTVRIWVLFYIKTSKGDCTNVGDNVAVNFSSYMGHTSLCKHLCLFCIAVTGYVQCTSDYLCADYFISQLCTNSLLIFVEFIQAFFSQMNTAFWIVMLCNLVNVY